MGFTSEIVVGLSVYKERNWKRIGGRRVRVRGDSVVVSLILKRRGVYPEP